MLSAEAIVYVIITDEKSAHYPNISYKLGDGSGCRVYNNSPPEFSFGALTFSQTYWLPDLGEPSKTKYEIQNYTVFMNREYFQWYHAFYSDYDLIINELIGEPHFGITDLEIKLGEERFSFGKGKRTEKLTVIFKSLLGVLMLEIVSLVYIYSTVITAPAFLIFVVQYFCCRDPLNRYQVYKVFPWLGIYMLPL